MIMQYWVGQIPLRNLSITVKDARGRQVNLTDYTDVQVRLLGSSNEEIDLTGAILNKGGIASGRFVFEWPGDRSLFDEPGDYLLQLVLKAPGAVDFTNEQVIRVKELGGKN